MQSITDLGGWLWFVAAVLLFILETIAPGIHFLWFGLAAAVVGGIALIAPISWTWQLILFAAIAIVTVFFVRRYTRESVAKTDEPALNLRGAHYIGRVVRVEEAIVNGRGKIRVQDTIWPVKGSDAPQGVDVRVTGTDGTVLIVGPL